jgi:hypothetical protein
MIPDYVELIARWAAEPQPAVAGWFTGRGFSAQRIRGGLLLGAPRSVVESVFSVTFDMPELPPSLPVPDAQKTAIASVNVVKPRDYFGKAPAGRRFDQELA